MRNFFWGMILAGISLLHIQCSNQGTQISGEIANASNLQVFLDKVIIGKANSIVGKADIGGNGQFDFSFPEGIEPGVYNLRLGAKRIFLAFDGTEGKVSITGDLNTLQNYDLRITGSEDAVLMTGVMRKLLTSRPSSADISNIVDTISNPLIGAFIAASSLRDNGEFIPIQRKALDKLKAAAPNSEMAIEYEKLINMIETQYAQYMSTQKIKVGEPAPDIRLKDPYGKEYSLSDLKGKVVLLDFWASWCGPCRRENPNVVRVYNKYKDKGFTIFSVSLDGIDTRTRSVVNANDSNIQDMMKKQRERWIEAIKQDGLAWEYHVSDLKKWESAPAATYGVTSIPRTFLIDREGKISAVNLRGAEQIEAALLNVL